MKSDEFSRPGAVDLSGITDGGSRFVVECDESNFNHLANESMKYPIVMEFYSAKAPSSVSTDLEKLSSANGGHWLLARVDVDKSVMIAQQLGVQAVPTVIGILAGQVIPLFQGTKDASEIEALINTLKQAAVANGITGRATPQAQVDENGEPAADPRFEAAEDALGRSDFEGALKEFEKVLAETPNDPDAIAGKAMAELLIRASKLDPVAAQIKVESPAVDDQLNLADLEMIQGQPEAAFNRIIKMISETSDDEVREKLRVRILDLFEVAGKTDPIVVKARRKLSTALFTH